MDFGRREPVPRFLGGPRSLCKSRRPRPKPPGSARCTGRAFGPRRGRIPTRGPRSPRRPPLLAEATRGGRSDGGSNEGFRRSPAGDEGNADPSSGRGAGRGRRGRSSPRRGGTRATRSRRPGTIDRCESVEFEERELGCELKTFPPTRAIERNNHPEQGVLTLLMSTLDGIHKEKRGSVRAQSLNCGLRLRRHLDRCTISNTATTSQV